jgi:hypothetical protein
MVRRTLCAVAATLLAGRLIAGELQVPTAAQIASCSADPVANASNSYFWKLRVTCADFMEFLSQADVVTEEQWLHNYSHVGDGDRTGRLTLHGGSVVRWMVRPGGLAYLEFAEGRKIYLARCCKQIVGAHAWTIKCQAQNGVPAALSSTLISRQEFEC